MEPITRKEMYLAAAAGQEVALPEPITREEMFLYKIAMRGGTGVSSWNDLTDKPFCEEIVDTQLVAPTTSNCWVTEEGYGWGQIVNGYLLPNEAYTVVFDGVTYKSPIKKFTPCFDGEEIASENIIGNAQIMHDFYTELGQPLDPLSDADKTGEPFCIIVSGTVFIFEYLDIKSPYCSMLVALAPDKGTHEVSISGKVLRLHVPTNTMLLPASTVEPGKVFVINAAGLAERCSNGGRFDGLCVGIVDDGVYNTRARCQLDGFIVVSYTGNAPGAGQVKLSADGKGGVKVDNDNGKLYTAVYCDTENSKIVIRL